MRIYRQRIQTLTHDQQHCLAEQRQRGQYLLLDFDDRQRGRFRATCQDGNEVGIDLPRGEILYGGAVVSSDDGAILEVLAAPQQLMQVTAADNFELMKAAYHLGNRHVRLMIAQSEAAAMLYFEPDEVLADMLQNLAVTVTRVERAFEPENGAYHRHDHHHDAPLQPNKISATALQGANWSALSPVQATLTPGKEAAD